LSKTSKKGLTEQYCLLTNFAQPFFRQNFKKKEEKRRKIKLSNDK